MFNPKSKIAFPNPTSVTAQQLQTLKTASGQPRQGSQSPNPVIRGGSQTFPQHVSGVTAILRKSSDVSTKTTITFQRPPNDGLYVDSSVYVSGYQGNPNPVKVASGQSPISFPLNNTGENLAFTVQANGPTGSAPLSSAPTTTSKLVLTPLATTPTPGGTGVIPNLPGAVINKTVTTFSTTPTFTPTAQISIIQITLTGNVSSSTFNAGSISANAIIVFEVIQDGTGNRTFVYPTNFLNAGGVGSSASQVTCQVFYWDGANAYAISPPTVYP